ncbi:hypothetical protein PO124_10730 [Bacillus licheniformis]|nr:hypothetical protein [Bacillus licheniformis]
MGAQALTTKSIPKFDDVYHAFGTAISQGTQILIGRHIGAKQFDEAYSRCLKACGGLWPLQHLLPFSSLCFKQLIGISAAIPILSQRPVY